MSQGRENEKEDIDSGEVDLSLFARQNEDAYTRYPITSQINQESRAMTQTYYPNIWDRTSGIPILWPPMRFNLQKDSLYIANERHMKDTISALGKNLSRIQSIAVPSRITPGLNIVSAFPAVPLPDYLHQWYQDHEETSPFQTLTHCIIEDPICSIPLPVMHRLSEPAYCAYIRRVVEEFFQEENRRNPEFMIPMVIVVPQKTGPTPCRDCTAAAIRIGLGFFRE